MTAGKPWLKWVLIGCGSLTMIGVVAVSGLLWFVSQHIGSSVEVGQPAPELVLTRPDGQKTELSELHGRVVLLEFWSSW